MTLNSPDPDLLHTFAEIVEHGSFTKTAMRIHRTQSAVSMQIRRLEDQLGFRLFERTGRTVKLTVRGEIFYGHTRRILNAYRDALALVNGRTLEGDVTIGMPDDLAASLLPAVLARFAECYPWVRLNLVCEPSKRLMNQVAAGVIDVALVTEGEGADAGDLVRSEPLVWACSADSAVYARDPMPLAIFHSSDVIRRSSAKKLEAQGRRVRIAVTSPSFSGIAAAVDAGVAVAVIFASSLRPGWRILDDQDSFPPLPNAHILLQRSSREQPQVVDELIIHIKTGIGNVH